MTPCPVRPSGSGPLAEVVRWMEREIRALQPISAPGMLTSTGPRGVVRRSLVGAVAGGGTDANYLTKLTVVNVLEDTLECSDDGGATVTHTVYKPWHLRVSSYAAFDAAVLDAFEESNTWPGGAVGDRGEYTMPYLMRANDGGTLDFVREVQQRYQLRYSVGLDIDPIKVGAVELQREVIHEAVWPPYYAAAGSAGGGAPGYYNGGGYDSYPTEAETILAAKDQYGANWHEISPQRQWVDVHSIIGDRETYTPDGSEFGRLINSNCNTNPGVVPR